MRVSNRKFAITGASRGLGAALAIEMARFGTQLVLLARTSEALQDVADVILSETGQEVGVVACDLANSQSASQAGAKLAAQHTDLDGLVHNGAMWLPGPMEDVSDMDIQACVASAAIGSLILTRHLLPVLKARENADIHTVVSTSGIPNRPLEGASVPFTAAKSAQAAFVHGLAQELENTSIRVTSVFPGDFADVPATDPAWNTPSSDHALSNREIVNAILFILNQPRRVSVRSLVIQ
ncbi:SDR family oxidoreductase [Roseovarius sp.]|uniref:SDR family oxidoreductase n=1 Tax=Roseovarius sp. TaxID=1486281 RepID=UPI003D0F3345